MSAWHEGRRVWGVDFGKPPFAVEIRTSPDPDVSVASIGFSDSRRTATAGAHGEAPLAPERGRP